MSAAFRRKLKKYGVMVAAPVSCVLTVLCVAAAVALAIHYVPDRLGLSFEKRTMALYGAVGLMLGALVFFALTFYLCHQLKFRKTLDKAEAALPADGVVLPPETDENEMSSNIIPEISVARVVPSPIPPPSARPSIGSPHVELDTFDTRSVSLSPVILPPPVSAGAGSVITVESRASGPEEMGEVATVVSAESTSEEATETSAVMRSDKKTGRRASRDMRDCQVMSVESQ